MSESLGDFLLEMREENKNQMQKGLKTKYIGDLGELFVANYLYELFEANNIRNYKIIPHKYGNEKYDLNVYINNEKYVIEVKTSTAEKYPVFDEIHFNNDFKYLILVWIRNDEEVYFAILNREEAKEIATPKNRNREYEDNWHIYAPEYFEENNKNFLRGLAKFLNLNKELEDLPEERKIELLEDTKEEIMQNPNAVINDFSGEVYQQWLYQYLSNYVDEVELMPRRYKYDIKYKEKGIEVKYSALSNYGEFQFAQIKPEDFDYILFIGFDDKENKFYFEIESREEYIENKRERVGIDDIASINGNHICVGKSFFRFKNDLTFEDFDKYIESH